MNAGNSLCINRAQVRKALSRLHALLESSPTPMARFLTNRPGWILEAEHLEANGEPRLRALLEAADGDSEALVFCLDGLTGHASRRQFHVRGLRNGTYVRQVNVRDRNAINIF